jgi:hypothetical protein
MNASDIEANLSARGILDPFLAWYEFYWDTNGTAVEYF